MQSRTQIVSTSLSTVEGSWVPPTDTTSKATTNQSQKATGSKVTSSSSGSANGPLKALSSHLKTA